jgi:hypothetical protein
MVRTQPADFGGLSDQHMNQPLDLTVMMYHYVREPGDEAEAGSGISGMTVHAEGDKPLPGSACLLTCR